MIFHSFRKIWKPEIYQGKPVMKGYFEGWYFKSANSDGNYICAIIPGVSFDNEGKDSHCFIQFFTNISNEANYYRYDTSDFSYSRDLFDIRLGKSTFRLNGIDIDIEDETSRIKGTLNFQKIVPWPVKWVSPGAMGWYAFIPFMECYHGVLSFNHRIQGQLLINDKKIDFSEGKGYIEKDWGKSFPEYHIWLQTNHFADPGTSLIASIANIPWLGKYFDGFLIGLLYKEKVYTFTTYSGAKLDRFELDEHKLIIHVRSKHYSLEIEVSRTGGTELRTPLLGEMEGRLLESLSATTYVSLYRSMRNGRELIYSDTGKNTGLEIEGQIPKTLKL